MAHYIKQGQTFHVSHQGEMDIHNKLPAGNYLIRFAPDKGFFLQQVESFVRIPHTYGIINSHQKRIYNTFCDRHLSTGVLLTGEQGSGKTQLAKNISLLAAEQGIPTLMVNTPYTGDGFDKFLQDIAQPCIVLFDEFEKVYDSEQQQGILTLLDGVFPTKKLFILTCNNKWSVDRHMHNRPSRLFYRIEFDRLDKAAVLEYCEENLLNKERIESVVDVSFVVEKFNFDMLKCLVEEMNRYDEEAGDAVKLMNINLNGDNEQEYSLQLYDEANNLIATSRVNQNPWFGEVRIRTLVAEYGDNEDLIFTTATKTAPKEKQKIVTFKSRMITEIQRDPEYAIIMKQPGYKLVMTPIFHKQYGVSDLL